MRFYSPASARVDERPLQPGEELFVPAVVMRKLPGGAYVGSGGEVMVPVSEVWQAVQDYEPQDRGGDREGPRRCARGGPGGPVDAAARTDGTAAQRCGRPAAELEETAARLERAKTAAMSQELRAAGHLVVDDGEGDEA